ncbi:hypothetical protein DYBT9275_04023 [Dyadobacter sp. CECT 9275]|uniref:Type II toxin-antitoxin system PemK/MazF family toxin n=1 Tax=Dyadobacter helix TaxID=2822344 RepID=A0A916JEI0_9BACT|nr:type II toxin-antitoxin system PemK/MazF family toxin [Dyadobacter sp. CECT 9275]CAG5007335.1 hypothetical protein DYBT9275_04023 [Dyadobacter sp. CECT 9275]
MPTYKQGDIVAVLFPFTDISQSKRRPAVVISNDSVNHTGDYLLVQITSQMKQDGLSTPLQIGDFIGTALPLVSFVRIHKIFLLNESLISHRIASVTPSFIGQLIARITQLIR